MQEGWINLSMVWSNKKIYREGAAKLAGAKGDKNHDQLLEGSEAVKTADQESIEDLTKIQQLK